MESDDFNVQGRATSRDRRSPRSQETRVKFMMYPEFTCSDRWGNTCLKVIGKRRILNKNSSGLTAKRNLEKMG